MGGGAKIGAGIGADADGLAITGAAGRGGAGGENAGGDGGAAKLGAAGGGAKFGAGGGAAAADFIPCAGVFGWKALGAASRGSSAPQPRQNL